MRRRNRLVSAILTLALVVSAPLAVLAGEDAPTRDAVTDRATDHATDRITDKVTDRITDKVTDRPTDHPTDRPTDRVTDRRIDRPTDRPIDRCLDSVDNQRRCLNDHHPHDFNVHQLIRRLINAHEWQKLVRLLNWLGWL
jgi:hypothetical protein